MTYPPGPFAPIHEYDPEEHAMPTPNIEELDALVAWAEAEHEKKKKGLPSEWDQGTWAAQRSNLPPSEQSPECGTACCLAGKAVARQGGVFLLETPYFGANMRADYAVMPTGQKVMIETEAEAILGLTRPQSDALFDADNNLPAVKRIVQEIKDGVEEPDIGPDYDEDDDYDI